MGKLISWIVLGIFVVIVPLGSWYYLRSGLEYRRAALKDLSRKDSLDVRLDTLNILKSKTTILITNPVGVSDTMVDNLLEQFGKVERFQILRLDSISQIDIKHSLDKFRTSNFILIDTGLYIRNIYKSDIGSIRKLVEHTAIVLPRQKELDIEMQKNKSNNAK